MKQKNNYKKQFDTKFGSPIEQIEQLQVDANELEGRMQAHDEGYYIPFNFTIIDSVKKLE